MKFIAKFILTAIAVPVFILIVLFSNVRFQILSPEFWKINLEKANVYSKISNIITGKLEANVIKGGSSRNDVAVLTDAITPLKIREFSEKNIESLLAFADGGSTEAYLYIPSVDVENFGSTLEKTSLKKFTSDYNISGIGNDDLVTVSRLGTRSKLGLLASGLLAVVILWLLYFLAPAGKKLGGMGTAILIPGIILTVLNRVAVYFLNFISQNYTGTSNLGTALGITILPPIASEIIKIWLFSGIFLTTAGILLFFVKKTAKTNLK